MKLTIGRRIIIGFAAALCVTLGLGAFCSYEVAAIKATSSEVTRYALPGITEAGNINALANLNYARTLQYVLATTEEEKRSAGTAVDAEREVERRGVCGVRIDDQGCGRSEAL